MRRYILLVAIGEHLNQNLFVAACCCIGVFSKKMVLNSLAIVEAVSVEELVPG